MRRRFVRVALLLTMAVVLAHGVGDFPPSPDPAGAVGGLRPMCILLGALTGIAIGTGQWLTAAGFLIASGSRGCLL